MSLPDAESKRHAHPSAEPTGDFVAHSAEGGTPASGRADPLLSLLRPPQADGELGRLSHFKDYSPLNGTPLRRLEIDAGDIRDFDSIREPSADDIGLHDLGHAGRTPAQAKAPRSMPSL